MITAFKKIWHFAGVEKGNIIKSIVLNFFYSLFHMLQIGAIFFTIKAIIEQNVNYQTVLLALGLIVISIIGKICLQYFSQLQQTHAGYFMAANKRIEIGNKIKRIPMGFFNKKSLGNLTGICTTVLGDVEQTAPMVLVGTLGGFITTVVFTIYTLVFDWRIGLVVLGIVIIYCLATALAEYKSRKAAPERQKSLANLVEGVLETIDGMPIVKSYNLNRLDNKKVDKAITECEKTNFGMEKVIIPYSMLQQIIIAVGVTLVLGLSAFLYLQGQMDIVYALMFIIIAFVIFENVSAAGQGASIIRVCSSSMDEACAIDNVNEIDINGKNVCFDKYDIQIKNVDFSYESKKILNNISINIKDKTTNAIIGPSGSGKSTICNLIARFWDVDSGSISIGGHDIKELSLESLMDKISIVFQDVYLFNDTITNNIKFGVPNASFEKVVEAAKKACCDDFIRNLPNGYETVLGDGITSLSGGERQRISIARAILKDSPIIILDEATANVDPENENLLIDAINELTKNKTIIMIAHRLKTVRNADQIIVIDQGNVVQKGTHKELIKQPGIYYDYVNGKTQAENWKIA